MTTMFAALDELSVETVILMGQDMCYGEAGETHVIDRGEAAFDVVTASKLKGNSREYVYTRPDWIDMVNWYENALYDTSVKRVINSSLEGAYIQGTEVLDIKSAMRDFKAQKRKFDDILADTPPTFNKHKDFDYHNICKQMIDVLKRRQKNNYIKDLLIKYEIADEKEDRDKSVQAGIEEISAVLLDTV